MVYHVHNIGSNGLGPRVFVSVSMNKINFCALADTGADITVMPLRTFKRLGIDNALDDNSLLIVRGIGHGVPFHTLGMIRLNLNIDSFSASEVTFHVISDECMSHDLILGADFMHEHYLAPSPAHGRLFYAPPSSDPELIGTVPQFVNTLKLSDKVKLLPNSVSFVTVANIEYGQSGNKDVYFEPSGELSKHSISFCRSIESLSSHNLTLEVVCYSNEPVSLDRGTVVGQLWQVEEMKPENYLQDNNKVHTDKIGSLFDFSQVNLTPEQLDSVLKMLNSNKDSISFDDSDVGRVDWVSHDIKFVDQNQQPIKIPPRRIHGKIRDGVELEIKKLYEEDLIEPSNSPWSAPVVPVRKPDGSIRLCIDYRAVNKVTMKDAFPLPNIEDMLYNLNGIKYFTSIDLVKGYYQVPMAQNAKPFTAFTTSMGHWQFKRMPFGLCNAPATFQRLMNFVLKDFSFDHIMAYLDDILVMNETFEDHLAEVDRVLSCLSKHGLKIKPKKCQLFRNEVKFLGHMISPTGLAPIQDHIQAILDYPIPTTVKQVHRFLGMINFYRRFIPNCSVISKPLSQVLKGKKLVWTSECQESFEKLRNCLVTPPILSYPDFSSDLPLELYTDASACGAGACLTQVQDGIRKVIAYVSTTFNQAELKYSVLDKELAALRWAIKRFKPFLYGRFFVVYSDHKPLSYLQGMKLLDARLARTLEELGEYDFEIRYVPGSLNQFADALSRSVFGQSVDLPSDPVHYLHGFSEKHVLPGADTLFRCLSVFKYGDELAHSDIRQETVDMILKSPDQYNLELTTTLRNQLKMTRHVGVMPMGECVQAFCNKQGTCVFIYEESIGFVCYKPLKLFSQRKSCYLRSYDSVYFSLLVPDGSVDLEDYRLGKIASSKEHVVLDILVDDREPQFVECTTLFVDDRNAHDFKLACRSANLSPCTSETSLEFSNSSLRRVSFSPEVKKCEYLQESPVMSCSPEIKSLSSLSGSEFSILNKEAVRDWQLGCSPLKKLCQLYRECSGDIAKIRNSCNRLKCLRKYSRYVDQIGLDSDGILIFDDSSVINSGFAFLVPFSVLGGLVYSAHDRNGHIGYDKLLYIVSQCVFHPSLPKVVSDILKSCEHCLTHKQYSSPVTPPIINIQVSKPFELIQVDTMELPHSFRGHKYVLNVIDQYSKWFSSQPLRDKTAKSSAFAFKKILAGLPSLPRCVMSDNGKEFVGSEFRNLLHDFNIQQKFVTPYSPQCNGLVERVNSTLQNILTGLCSVPTDWDLYLDQAVILYNNTFHREINMTPSEFLTSLSSKLPFHPKNEPFWKKGSSAFKPYKVGDKVGLKIQGRSGLSKKLRPRYKGPYIIKHVNSNQKSYQLTSRNDSSCEVRAHHSQLRPWYDSPKYLQKSLIFNEPIGEKSVEPDISNSSAFIPGLSSQFSYADVPVAFTLPTKNLIPVTSSPSLNSNSILLPEEPVLPPVVCTNSLSNSVIPITSNVIPQFVLQTPPPISSYSSSFGSYLVENTPMGTPNQSFQETCSSINVVSIPNKDNYGETSCIPGEHGTISQLEQFFDQYDTPEFFPMSSTPVRNLNIQTPETGLDDINMLVQSMVVQGSIDSNQTIPSIVSFSEQSPQGDMSALPDFVTNVSTSTETSLTVLPARRITRQTRREFLPDMTAQNALNVIYDNAVP